MLLPFGFLLALTLHVSSGHDVHAHASQIGIRNLPLQHDNAVVPPLADSAVFCLHSEPGTAMAEKERQLFLDVLQQKNIRFELLQTFDVAVNAVGLAISFKDVDKIGTFGLTRDIWESRAIKLNGIQSSSHEGVKKPLKAHLAPSIKRLHDRGITGKGVRIAIVDSGVDYTHPDLGGCFGPKCRVAFGFDYVGDDFEKGALPVPDKDPMDNCSGHGTHVAGIAAANGRGIVGVAPLATLGAYRVVSCKQHGLSSHVAQALEQAYVDKMDIINLSMSLEDRENIHLATTITKLLEANIVVVSSADNNGSQGMWRVASFGRVPDIISVGSANSPAYTSGWFTLSIDPKRPYPYQTQCGAIPTTGSIRLELVIPIYDQYNGRCTLPSGLQDKVVYFAPNMCNQWALFITAKSAGVLAIITSFDIDSITSTMDLAACPGVASLSLPSLVPSLIDLSSDNLHKVSRALLKHKDLIMNLGQSFAQFDDSRNIQMSGSSSWGPDRQLNFKPDIVAPGVNIHSTYSRKLKDYTALSGASMAVAYVSGSIALYLHSNGGKRQSPRKILRSLQNSAHIIQGANGEPRAAIAHQGAGFIDIERMITGTLKVEPSVITLRDSSNPKRSSNNVFKTTITITNTDDTPHQYYITHMPMLSLRNQKHMFSSNSIESKLQMGIEVTSSMTSDIIYPNKPKDVTITFTEPTNIPSNKGWFYSGYMVIDRKGLYKGQFTENAIYVPYLGYKGEISKLDRK
ncbi:peptidase S8/S53 domain-containing protein [Syncephalis fuscata]|nr:peptidase S8/S53 domain-containing protein [Syncephalis fuscata]